MARARKRTLLGEIGQAFSPVTKSLKTGGRKFVVRGQPAFAFAVIPRQEPIARPKPIIKKQKRRRK